MSRFFRQSMLPTVVLSLVVAVTALGCEPQFEDDVCDSDDDCFPDEECVENRCLVIDDYQHETNECGGTEELDGELDAPCGPCNLDRLECSEDGEQLQCDGDTQCPDLDVVTQLPTDVEATTATLNGEVMDFPEIDDLVELGFCWARGQSPDFEDHCQSIDDIPEQPGHFSLGAEGLDPGSEYSVAAYFKIEVGHQALVNDVDFTTHAPAVENLETESTPEAVVVSWQHAEGAEGYRLYRDGDEIAEIVDGADTSYEDDQTPGGDVSTPQEPTATDNRTDGVDIGWEAAESIDGPTADYEVVAVYPDTESDFSETVEGYRSGPEITGYELYAGDDDPDADDWMFLGDTTGYLDEDAPQAELVAQAATASSGQFTDRIVLQTDDAQVDSQPQQYRLRTTYGDDDQFHGASTPEFEGQRGVGSIDYQWQRSTDDASFSDLTGVIGTSAEDDDLATIGDGSTYYYRAEISAAGADTVTTSSDAGSVLIAESGQVSNLSVSNIDASSADFSAQVDQLGNPEADEHGFCYGTDASPDLDDTCLNLGAPTSGASMDDTATGLQPGTTYFVRAYIDHDQAGTGFSSEEQFTTAPTAPDGLTASTDVDDRVELNWNSVAEADEYVVYRDGSEIATFDAADGSSYEDDAAPEPALPQAPESVQSTSDASDITLSWDAVSADRGDNDADYTVRAKTAGTAGEHSDPATGYRSAPDIDGYQISIDAGSWGDTSGATSHTDSDAPAPTLEFGQLQASDDNTDGVELDVDAVDPGDTESDPIEPTDGAQVSYEVRTVDISGRTSSTSATATAQRTTDEATISGVWQFDDAGDWQPLVDGDIDGTDAAHFDGDISPGQSRTYRIDAEIDGTDDTQTTSTTIEGTRLEE